MYARSPRRVLSFLGSLLVLAIAIAGIIFTQGGRGASVTATPITTTPTATVVIAAHGATATSTSTAPPRRAEPTAMRAAGAGDGRQNPTVTPTLRQQSAAPTASDGLPTIAVGALPPEAQRTIGLIDRGGPFPYDRDGIVFGNRERLLPDRSDGYYREYTVITPGSDDRGARRIIAGQDGQLYYTADHYASFRRVLR